MTERVYKTTKKQRAQARAYYAIRVGDLVPRPCEVCGATKRVHAHHDDYDKPLDVRWLCPSHHHEAHGKTARSFQRPKKYEGYYPEKTVIYVARSPVKINPPTRTYWPKWWRNRLILQDDEKSA